MAQPWRYLVPVEVAIHARDVGSGKLVSNITYWINRAATGVTPAYGAPITGSDMATFDSAFQTSFSTTVAGFLNHNYSLLDITYRLIIGKQFKTPFTAILALVPGAPINITTSVPHGLTTGDIVFIQGVTSPPGANGTWRITVTGPDDFTLDTSNDALPWTGNGRWQLATGALQFTYADKFVSTPVIVGAIVGDALPLFAAASIRRLNAGTGKNFRSRLSFSPMSESDSLDGGLLPARITAINTAMNTFLGALANGGADAGAGVSVQIAVSKKLAVMQPPIFAQSATWTALVGSYAVQRNLGSMTRRKPRLTATIS